MALAGRVHLVAEEDSGSDAGPAPDSESRCIHSGPWQLGQGSHPLAPEFMATPVYSKEFNDEVLGICKSLDSTVSDMPC
eukprot:9513263-Lingulodinium_polyedra.AAC.1